MTEELFGVKLIEDKNESDRIIRLIHFLFLFSVEMKMPVEKVNHVFTSLSDHKGELTVRCHSRPHTIIKETITRLWDEKYNEYETVFEWGTESGFEQLKVIRS
jgi:hypothetical protein